MGQSNTDERIEVKATRAVSQFTQSASTQLDAWWIIRIVNMIKKQRVEHDRRLVRSDWARTRDTALDTLPLVTGPYCRVFQTGYTSESSPMDV